MPRHPGSHTRHLRALNLEGTRDHPAHAGQVRPLLIFIAGLAVLIAGSAVVPSAQAGAGLCRVPSTAYPTIQAAVNAATCATITVAAGTYFELLIIARDVTIRGAGQESTAVDGGGSSPVVTIARGRVTLRGVTIQGAGNFNPGSGGGIWNESLLTVEDSTVSGNSRGIQNMGTLTVQNSTILRNRSDSSGGIGNRGTLTVKSSTITENGAEPCGGILNLGTGTVEDSTVSGNDALENGGGIFNSNGGTVTLTDVTFENNIPNDCTGCPGLL